MDLVLRHLTQVCRTIIFLSSIMLIGCNTEDPVSVFDVTYKNVAALKMAGYKEASKIDRVTGMERGFGIYSKVIGDTTIQFWTAEDDVISKSIWLETNKTDTILLFRQLEQQGYVRTLINPERRTYQFVKRAQPVYSFNFGKKQLTFYAHLKSR